MPLTPGQPNPFLPLSDKFFVPQPTPLPPQLRLPPLNLALAPADHTQVASAGKALGQHSFLDEISHADALTLTTLFGGSLRIEDTGEAVRELQTRLTALGYGVEASAVMGPSTCEVLKHFQQDHGLEPTGEFGATTLNALKLAEQKQDEQQASISRLKAMKPKELHKLGRKDSKAFFKALLPAALESERKYGSPAVMTLVQAAVESDFARSPIGGYNIFGIKGEGPAGTVRTETREVIKGKSHYVREPFAKYHNFYEAVGAHGKLYNNGHYDKAMAQYAKDKNVLAFVENIAKTYATDPNYARTLKTRIAEYGLLELVAKNR